MDRRDYEEPRCPMDNSMWVKNKVNSIPVQRVIAREDEYLAQNDYASAEKHLLYWWQEAELGNDERGKLLLCNELMGLHRKMGNGQKAKEYAGKALAIVDKLELGNSVAGATAYLNSGTVYKAFGEPGQSLEYFEKARDIYEKELEDGDSRKAGLYNNMALTLADLGRFSEAREMYMSAIEIVKDINKPDEAITWLNLADCIAAESNTDEAVANVRACLDKAEVLLDGVPEGERDGYYAFVCEKCAPVFADYGNHAFAEKLRQRSEAIYAGSRK